MDPGMDPVGIWRFCSKVVLVEVPIKLGVENALLRQIGLPFQAYKEAIKAWCQMHRGNCKSSRIMMVHAWRVGVLAAQPVGLVKACH